MPTDLESRLARVLADLTACPWPDETFDVVLCSHVLEHIPDDERAMGELHRILRPGGWGIVLVPFTPDRATVEDPTVTSPEERRRLFGQEDHVRKYGREYLERLWRAGFEVDYGVYASNLGDGEADFYGFHRDEVFVSISKPQTADVPVRAPVRRWGAGPEGRE